MRPIDRLLQFMGAKNMSAYAFEKKVGIGNGYLNKQTKGGGPIGSNVLEKIKTVYPDLNLTWIITGSGDMEERPTTVEISDTTGFPLVSVEAIAGFGSDKFLIREEDIQARYVIPDFVDIDFMLRVKGNSMSPKYNSGDVVACRKLRRQTFIQWNKAHVVATKEQGILIKRLHPSEKEDCYLLVSDNPEYRPFIVPIEEITGVAIVVGVVRLE